MPSHPRDTSGQATVEFVALLPVLVVVGLLCWQAAVAGQAVWLSGSAARSAARAQALAGDPRAAASRVLPHALRSGLRVRASGDGSVAVTVAIPAVVGGMRLGTTTARAQFKGQTQ